MLRIKFLILLLTLLITSIVGAEVIDNSKRLYISKGDEYYLQGEHSYNNSIQIEGKLYVTPYDNSNSTGTLHLSSPDITINGIIDANGAGFTAQQGPGCGGCAGGGAGYGGKGGDSGYNISGCSRIGGPTYGDPCSLNAQKGSGGGNGGSIDPAFGGSGGGVVILSAETLQIGNSGVIAADGNDGEFINFGAGGGSGGCILIQVLSTDINGRLTAKGGNGNGDSNYGGGGGAGGRIKILYGRNYNFDGQIDVGGGQKGGNDPDAQPGQSGTSRILQTDFNNNDILFVPENQTLTMHGSHQYNVAAVINGQVNVTHYDGSTGTGILEIIAPLIDVNGIIDANYAGYNGEGKNTGGPGEGNEPAAGAGYGGKGGDSYWGLGNYALGGSAYGEPGLKQIQMGSAGADLVTDFTTFEGGSGGGAVTLTANELSITGLISADGMDGFDNSPDGTSGAGSGGGIMLCADHCSLHGNLTAKGGKGTVGSDGTNTLYSGAAAGGRIKIFYGDIKIQGLNIFADGGTAEGQSAQYGEKGTCSIQKLLPGDINNDGVINFTDFNTLADGWLDQTSLE